MTLGFGGQLQIMLLLLAIDAEGKRKSREFHAKGKMGNVYHYLWPLPEKP